MRKKRLNLIALCVLMTLGIGYRWYQSQQAPSIATFTIKQERAKSQTDIMDVWLSEYLLMHQNPWNRKAPISDFIINTIDTIDPLPEEEGWWLFNVQLTVHADHRPDELFTTRPLTDENTHRYTLSFVMNPDNNLLGYQQDYTQKTYDEKRRPTILDQETDQQANQFDAHDMFLKVREDEHEPWIDTPIPSEKFTTVSQGHFSQDRRTFSRDNHHEIVYQDNGKLLVTATWDHGTTWQTTEIFDEPPLSLITSAHLDFIDDTGVLALSSHVALNSEIVSYHYSNDQGKSWHSNPIPNYTYKITGASLGDAQTLWVSRPNSPLLYKSIDFGATFEPVSLPAQTLTDTNIAWESIFVQASVPERKEGGLVVRLTQNNGDYKLNADAIFKSDDSGRTWTFVDYHVPPRVMDK